MDRKFDSYRLSKLAETDLENIFTYTAENWSLDQAYRYTTDLQAGILGLVAGTKIGRRLEVAGGYFSLLAGSHKIIYREAASIYVVRILHKAMDTPRHIDFNDANSAE